MQDLSHALKLKAQRDDASVSSDGLPAARRRPPTSSITTRISRLNHHLPNMVRDLRLQWYTNPDRVFGEPNHYLIDTERNQAAQLILVGRVAVANVGAYGNYRNGGQFPAEKSYYRLFIDSGPISSDGDANPFFASYRQQLAFLQAQLPGLDALQEQHPNALRSILPDDGLIHVTKKVALRTARAPAVDAHEREVWDPDRLLPAVGNRPYWLQSLLIYNASTSERLGPGSIVAGDIVAVNCSMVCFQIGSGDDLRVIPKLEINSIRLLQSTEIRNPTLRLAVDDLIA